MGWFGVAFRGCWNALVWRLCLAPRLQFGDKFQRTNKSQAAARCGHSAAIGHNPLQDGLFIKGQEIVRACPYSVDNMFCIVRFKDCSELVIEGISPVAAKWCGPEWRAPDSPAQYTVCDATLSRNDTRS
jgi:hypothetical protein